MSARHYLAAALLGATVAGCNSVERMQQGIATEMVAQSQQAASSAYAIAEKVKNEARGTKTCKIVQYTSAYSIEQDNAQRLKDGRPPTSTGYGSAVGFEVYKTGAVGMFIERDLYPGTPIYLSIAGERSKSSRQLMLSKKALAAMFEDQPFAASWTNWPYGSEADYHDRFDRFREAYDACLEFFRS